MQGAITTVTFDCYGTLIDWDGGLGCFLYAHALASGDEQPQIGEALRHRWEAIQFEIIQGDYRSYKDVLAESLRRWCDEFGYPYRAEDGEALARSMRSWQPFKDTRPALEAARENGVQLVIISNTDRDIIAHSVRQIGVPFDAIITAQDAGAYKPDPRVFETVLDRLVEDPATMLHVAFGFKYDIGPAQKKGWQTVWVNRGAEPKPNGATPDHTWRDLWGLAGLVGSAT